MTIGDLERRLSLAEAEIARLKTKVEGTKEPEQPWWEKIAGTFANDPYYDEAMRLGREWRESQRPKPAKPRKKRHADS